ncbi:MAG: hypothetical protein IJ417_04045, partial [Bacteroidaceae bacterium]|nr:hypothetical protein [Bacteroidaceae bacterium]
YTIKDLTNGIIELEQTTGDFCYLKFLTTQYASAGELKLEAINEQTSYGNVSYKSSVPYDEATVTVTNKANTFAGFAYATEDVLSTQGTNYGTADADRTVRAVRGSRVGVRVFFPGSFKEQTESFTFKMKSACYELHNDEAYKYSGAKTDIGDGSHIITVEDNGLAYDKAKDLCYLDLVLSATTWDNEETIRFLTDATTDATNYIRFYPYNVSIISDKQNYPITVEQSLDKSNWSTITDDSYTLTSASLATQGTSVYYRITLPAVGPYTGNKTFDFTIISDGLEVDNTNSSIAGVQKNDNDTIVFKGLTPKQNDEATWILALKTSKALESGSNITATILSGETVKPDTLESVLNNGGFLVKYQLGSETAEGVVAPESESVKADNPQITIPKNFTLYKEGYTLTAWKDEEGTKYAIGTKVTVTKNMTLTPVFTENTVSLDDRKEAVTIHWDFRRQNGAPTVAWEGKTGLVWVAQASVTNGGTTETIDVKLDFSTSPGKVANGNWNDWALINGGTTFTIPSQNKATVKMESYNDIYNANAAQHMTIAGDIIDQTSKTLTNTYEGTYTYEGIDKEIDIVFGNAGSYYRYVEVTLPEHNVIPTTDDVPFYIRRGILYDNGTESDYSSQAPHFEDDDHIDYMQNEDYAVYKIYNTEESYYKVSFMAASNKNQISEGDVSVTVSLVAENETEYLTYGTVDIIEGSSWSDYQTYMLTTTQTVPIGNYTLKVTFNNTAGSTTCNLKDISLTKTDRPQMTVDWVDANGNVLNNAYSCYVGEKIYLRMKADTDGTIPFKLELRQSTTSTNPGKNNNPAEILKQIETNIPNFTVNTIGTEVGLTNVRVGDIYTICYEVMQAGYLLFKISSDMPAGASNYTTLFNILGKTDVSGTTPLVTVTVNNITFSNPQYRISGTDTWLDISNDYVSIGYGTGSLIDVRINTNGYTTDNITFNWGNSTDYSNASIVTEGSNTYAVMKNIPAYSNSVNFYNGSNSENTYSFQIATEEAKTYEMYVESSDETNSAYVYKENSNIIESSNSIIAIAGTRNRVGEKTIDGQSFTAYHGLKSDDADNDSGNQTVSINTTGYGKKMFLTLYATNKFKYTAANSSSPVLKTPIDNVFAAELEVGTTKIHRGVGDYYDANGNLYTAAGEGLTQVGEVAIYYVKVSNVNTNQSE